LISATIEPDDPKYRPMSASPDQMSTLNFQRTPCDERLMNNAFLDVGHVLIATAATAATDGLSICVVVGVGIAATS